MDTKVKTKEVGISNDNRPKKERIGDYWNEELSHAPICKTI